MTDKRILVVDDDDAIRALLFTILRRRGFKVDSARTGLEAMERCARCHYAVMLLDLMMPHMNGYEVLDAMSKLSCEKRPIIIVLTAGTEPRNLAPDIVAGTIRKPFDVELLLDTIAGCVSMSNGVAQRDECPAADSDLVARERDLSRPPN
jgi:CheY-like chemotaxis protein